LEKEEMLAAAAFQEQQFMMQQQQQFDYAGVDAAAAFDAAYLPDLDDPTFDFSGGAAYGGANQVACASLL
jgi:hypothetical protein